MELIDYDYPDVAKSFLINLVKSLGIKNIRKSRKLTKKQFSKYIGVCERSVWAWEKGILTPNDNNCFKVAKFLIVYAVVE